jgi:hypothetical protein
MRAAGVFDPVDHGVAEHVFERRQHSFQHLAVELSLTRPRRSNSAFLPTSSVAAWRSRRAQALDVALEWDHARAHEPVLYFRDDTTLLLQQVLGLAVQAGRAGLRCSPTSLTDSASARESCWMFE